MKCHYCGTEYEGNFCPECGAKTKSQSSAAPPPVQPVGEPKTAYQKPKKQKKPIYKRWWFIVIAAIALLTIISSISGGSQTVKIKWTDMVLGSQLPKPPANKGEIHANSADELRIDIKNISGKQYDDYVEACKSKGFTVDAESNSSTYNAYNAEGYKLSLSHFGSDADLSIKLEKPMEMSTITWPTGKAGSQLPAPKSTTGKFSYEYDDHFRVYVGETSRADYEQYAADCAAAGFNIDYDKGDSYYRADNAAGYHISLKYEGNSIMSVEISAPKGDDASTSTPAADPAPDTAEPKDTNLVNGMRKDFKDAMDSYEAFMDEYVAFMKKYSDNPSDVSLLADYARYMSKYGDMVDKFNKWESEDLNDAELAYYMDVQTRVNQKLLAVAN